MILNAMKFDVMMGGKLRRVELAAGRDATLDGQKVEMDAELLQPGVLSLRIGKNVYRCWLDSGTKGQVVGDARAVVIEGRRFSYSLLDPRGLKRKTRGSVVDGAVLIKAPMPGRVVSLLAQVGDAVEAKQGVVVIEAMKMQNELKSPKAGRVVRVPVASGDTVQAGAVLVEIE